MQCRKLKRLWNTKRTVHGDNENIYVDSYMCSELIKISKKSFKITYALETHCKDPLEYFRLKDKGEMYDLYIAIKKSIESGEFQKYITDKNDDIKDPVNVWFIDYTHAVVYCDIAEKGEIGHRYITASGRYMFDNDNWLTKKEALSELIRELNWRVDRDIERIDQKTKSLEDLKKRSVENKNNLEKAKEEIKK